jgi:hypothetical protein
MGGEGVCSLCMDLGSIHQKTQGGCTASILKNVAQNIYILSLLAANEH